jgi:hypothetical protein
MKRSRAAQASTTMERLAHDAKHSFITTGTICAGLIPAEENFFVESRGDCSSLADKARDSITRQILPD